MRVVGTENSEISPTQPVSQRLRSESGSVSRLDLMSVTRQVRGLSKVSGHSSSTNVNLSPAPDGASEEVVSVRGSYYFLKSTDKVEVMPTRGRGRSRRSQRCWRWLMDTDVEQQQRTTTTTASPGAPLGRESGQRTAAAADTDEQEAWRQGRCRENNKDNRLLITEESVHIQNSGNDGACLRAAQAVGEERRVRGIPGKVRYGSYSSGKRRAGLKIAIGLDGRKAAGQQKASKTPSG